MKIVPVLGASVLLGLIVQIIIGFIGGIYSSLHTFLGFAGIAFAVLFVVIALRSKKATKTSRITMLVFLALVLSQTYLGFTVLTTNTLRTSHLYTAFTILIVAIAAAGITARRRQPATQNMRTESSNNN
ncbi:MAG: hypothetical protein FJ358_06825 [Thaumarchaeota archaeon]|nr:hypothetical protein [Nitrososphaerota archaeon]